MLLRWARLLIFGFVGIMIGKFLSIFLTPLLVHKLFAAPNKPKEKKKTPINKNQGGINAGSLAMIQQFMMNNMTGEGKDMTEQETRRMFETLQNTVTNQKVPVPTPD
jgi:hypothetical protein